MVTAMTDEERAREIACSIDPSWTFHVARDGMTFIQKEKVIQMLTQAIHGEREECAKVADDHRAMGYMSGRERSYCHEHGDEIAAAIRARGGKT